MRHVTEEQRKRGRTEVAPAGEMPAFEVRPFEVGGGPPAVVLIAAGALALTALIVLAGLGALAPAGRAPAAASADVAWTGALKLERPASRAGTPAAMHVRQAAAVSRRHERLRAAHRRERERRAARQRAAAKHRSAATSTSAGTQVHKSAAPTTATPRPTPTAASSSGSSGSSGPNGGSHHSSGGGSSSGSCKEYALC